MSTSPPKDTVLLRSCVRAEFFGEALATVLRVCTLALALAGGSKLVTGGVWGACRSGKERTGSDGSTRAGDWPAQAVAVTNTGEGSAGAAPGRPDTGPPSTSPRPPDKPPLCGAEPWRLLAKLVTLNGVVQPDAPLVLLLLLLLIREESATTLWKFPDGLSGGTADEFVTLAPAASLPFLSLFARLVLLGATLLMLLLLLLLVVVLEAALPLSLIHI